MTETFAAASQLLATLYHDRLDRGMAAGLAAFDLSNPDEDPILSEARCLEGMTVIKKFCSRVMGQEAGNESLLKAASNDFHDLFVGPHKLLAAPWSSVYLDPSRTVFGPTAIEVRKLFAANGLEIPEGTREPSDHVAYEWQFLSDMCRKATEGDEEDGQAFATAAAFFNSYLATWMPAFCMSVQSGAITEFYRGLAVFTEGIVQIGKRLFG